MSQIRPDFLAFGRPNFGDLEIEAVTRTIRSGWVGMGAEVIAFEQELTEFTSAPHVVTVNSCTSALHLSLLALGVGPDDEVICPSLTWCSTANAAIYLGAKPVFCDVDTETLCVTSTTIREKLSSRTKAVMVVHMGGYAVDVAALRRELPKNVAIVEDAAHALGSRYPDGKAVGTSGNLTCFSFYANKNLSTGEGGAIALTDAHLADNLRSLRQHGMKADAWKRYTHPQNPLDLGIRELGYKMNYTDLQASIGRVQLQRQQEFHEIRLSIATAYFEALRDLQPALGFQKKVLDDTHARHLFVIRIPTAKLSLNRDDILLKLRKRNIGASIHYPPLHGMQIYAKHQPAPLSKTEDLSKEILTLPISASMTMADVDYVSAQLRQLILESRKQI
jgi:dTDP-4-amino-4,6-dideoxygalactose transaminase